MTYDSIYPEFFRTGLGRLRRQDARNGDFLGLFSALDHFRRDLTEPPDIQSILKVTELYVLGLELFETIGFFMINPTHFGFDLVQCTPPDRAATLESLVAREIKAGRFAWALRQNAPVFFSVGGPSGPPQGVFHTLGVRNQRLGMFCGLLKGQRAPRQEITFNLLSILLGGCSDALVGVRTTAELRNQVLAANDNLQRTLRENEILALIPAENPSPVLRLSSTGLVLYSNHAGAAILRTLGCRVGDLISGDWLSHLADAFERSAKVEFEASFQDQMFDFMVVPVPASGYANFYGTDITARKQAQNERERLIEELQEALAKVKTLSGLVPICAWCKKVRDDRGFWNEVEVYVQSHSEATFSHGVCPDCRKKWPALPAARGG